jgi:hypothetical protein
MREQFALNAATGAAFVGVVGLVGGGGAGSVTVPPEPFTRSILFAEDPTIDPRTPVVAFDMIACATCAGVAPGLLWR